MVCMSVYGKKVCVNGNIINVDGHKYVCNGTIDDINIENEEEILMLIVFLDMLCVPEK